MVSPRVCRAFRNVIGNRVSSLDAFQFHGTTSLPLYTEHSGDSKAGLHSFLQKHMPIFPARSGLAHLTHSQPQPYSSIVLPRFQSATNNFVQKSQCQLNVHPPSKYETSKRDAAAIFRFVRLGQVKKKLRGIPDACISYNKLLQLCFDSSDEKSSCENENEGREFIKMLEQSGDILRLGNTFYLHPDQVARTLEKMLPLDVYQPQSDFRRDRELEELLQLQKEKAEIDAEAERRVRKEVWVGLGAFSLQTAVLFRLTFWELSWDVMEPISFFLTSAYGILSYAFFLNTSRDASMESYFAARFKVKQKKLMKKKNFDLERYTRLRKTCQPQPQPQPQVS